MFILTYVLKSGTIRVGKIPAYYNERVVMNMYYNLMVYNDTLGGYECVAKLDTTDQCIRHAIKCGYTNYKVTTLKWNDTLNKYENRITYVCND